MAATTMAPTSGRPAIAMAEWSRGAQNTARGARIHRCSATAEIGNNQIKNIEYEQLPMRLDRFLVQDAAAHGGVVARFERELSQANDCR